MTMRLAMTGLLTGCVAARGYVVSGARMSSRLQPPGMLHLAHGDQTRTVWIARVDGAGGRQDVVHPRDFAQVQADARSHPDQDYLLVDGQSLREAATINGVLGSVFGLAAGALASSACVGSLPRGQQDDATPYFCMLLAPVGGLIGGLVGGFWRPRAIAVHEAVGLPMAAPGAVAR